MLSRDLAFTRRLWLSLWALPAVAVTAQDPLYLQHPADQQAFRTWFTALAELMYYRAADELPAEVSDCSALLRFAFRESLRAHTGEWARQIGLEGPLPFSDVRQYRYPRTPRGANLFRTGAGDYREFADAQTLMRHNARRIGTTLDCARPADLLFFHNLDSRRPEARFHSMIWLGRSQFEAGAASRIIYHTGSIGDSRGEIRRPLETELLNHPDPRWRPVAANPNFLGVYRWNLLWPTL